MRPPRWSVIGAVCAAACSAGCDAEDGEPPPSGPSPSATTPVPREPPPGGSGGAATMPPVPTATPSSGGIPADASAPDASAPPPVVTPAGSGVLVACGVTRGSGRTCTGVEAFVACARAACGAQLESCFGPDDAAASFAGTVCADYATCATRSPDPCNAACTASSSCQTCLESAGACIQASGCPAPFCTGGNPEPEPEPADGGPPGGGVIIAGTCAALEACCGSLDGAGESACLQTLEASRARGGDADCAVVLTTYEVAGACKRPG